MRRTAIMGLAALLSGPAASFAAEDPAAAPPPAQTSPAQTSPPQTPATVPPSADATPSAMGIGLENYPYPHPIRFLPLDRKQDAVHPVRMAYMDIPPRQTTGTPRTALLLGGRTLPGDAWAGTIQALTDSGWRVVVPDQIGMGKSAKPEGPWRFDAAVADISALLDKLAIQQADVVGFSMGGMLAVKLARAHPERVRRLVLLSPLGLEDTRKTVPDTPRDQLEKLELGLTPEAYLYELTSQWHTDPAQAHALVALRERLKGSAEYPRWVAARIAAGQAIREQPLPEDLPRLPGPTLIVVGDRDRAAPGRAWAREADRDRMGHVADLAAAGLPRMQNAQLVRLDAGHLPQLERPEAWRTLLLDFLGP